jgi:hypothetical protein
VILLVLGVLFWPDSSPGMLVVRMAGSGGTLRVIDRQGAIVTECPVASGALSLRIAPGSYRVVVTGGAEPFSRDVTIDAKGTETLLYSPSLDDSRPPHGAKPPTPASEIKTPPTGPSGKPAG